MTRESNRNAANIRIYCDNEERRWERRIDPETGQNLGAWEDKENWILYPYRISPGCLHTRGGARVDFAETFTEYMKGEPPVKQADIRATISVSLLLYT